MVNQVPEKLINFRVYLDGTDLIGVADVRASKCGSNDGNGEGCGLGR